MSNETTILRLHADLAAIQLQWSFLKLARKYNPAQPRVPAGNPDGGQWTDGWVRVAENDAGEVVNISANPRSLLPRHIPSTADIDRNISQAEAQSPSISDLGEYPTMYLPAMLWFRNQVDDGGPWDYKLQDSKFEDFGNFNYGATGKAMGFSEDTLLRMAGVKQVDDRHSQSGWGTPVNILQALIGIGGVAPYGDDPRDQEWIKQGFKYYDAVKAGKRVNL